MKPSSLAILVAVIVGFAALFVFVMKQDAAPTSCPTHWHATFGVFIPGSNGAPSHVDFTTPRAASGQLYYQLGVDPAMDIHNHMHLSGTEATGAADGWQIHMEELSNEHGDRCIGVADRLHAFDIGLSKSTLTVFGEHKQTGQTGSWTANATASLRYFVEVKVNGNWTWGEWKWEDVQGYQLKDGESLLVAYGHYSDAQITGMESQIPAPNSLSRR